MVARLVRDEEVPSLNLGTPTNLNGAQWRWTSLSTAPIDGAT